MSEQPFLLWITGLAGSGKTTLAKEVYNSLKPRLPATVLLDGDIFREVMGNTLGHGLADRKANAWRIARMCNALTRQGINVVCSTMSLYSEIHDYNRNAEHCLIEVFLDVSMEELRRRDKKELYSKAASGETANVTGIDLPFDTPKNPELKLTNNEQQELSANISKVLECVTQKTSLNLHDN